MREDLVLPPLFQLVELDLAAYRRHDRREVDDPCRRNVFAGQRRSAHRRGGHGLDCGHRQPGRHAGAPIDLWGVAHQPGEACDHLQQVVGDGGKPQRRLPPVQRRLLADQGQFVVKAQRVVGADFGAEAVLEGCDDPAPVGVVLGIRRSDEKQVEREPQDVAPDLDVAFLQHVQERYLDPFGQVGKFVHAEDAAVGAWYQTVVDGLRVTQGSALRDLDRVDVPDQIADAGVRSGQLLAEPFEAVLPGHRGVVTELGDQQPAPGAHRGERVIIDLAAGDHRRPLVQQAHQGADQAGLALPAFPEEDDVVPGEQSAFDLGEHGVVEADDAGKPVLATRHPGEGVVAQFRAYGPVPVS